MRPLHTRWRGTGDWRRVWSWQGEIFIIIPLQFLRGIIMKISPWQDHKRLQSPVPRHLVRKGRIKTFLSSIYHPVEHNAQKQLSEELESFYNTMTMNAELLSGQDINANIGVWSKISSDTIGSHGLDNRNAKVRDLIFLLKSIKFRVLLTYFNHSNYNIWQTFSSTTSPHILDNFICSQPFFRQVKC